MSETEPSRSGSSPSRFDPFRELDDFRERLGRILEQTFTRFDQIRGGTWAPLVDIEETDDAFVIEADVPGAKPEDVTVEVDDGELRIAGEIRERARTGIVRRQTRLTGRFEFRSTLPRQVDPERIEASLAHGVLTVRAPKLAPARPRRIEITTGEAAKAEPAHPGEPTAPEVPGTA
jgi:HSP20 family protein